MHGQQNTKFLDSIGYTKVPLQITCLKTACRGRNMQYKHLQMTNNDFFLQVHLVGLSIVYVNLVNLRFYLQHKLGHVMLYDSYLFAIR